MSDLNIYQRINAVMTKISYVKKDKAVTGGGQNYQAVTHDNVTAMIRPHLVELGIVVQLEQLRGELVIKRDVDKGIKMHLYSGDYAISFVNIDKPEEKATVTMSAHAADNGDKAPGKAASYATKYAMLKMFSIETGENEESRAYEAPDYTDQQKEMFDYLLDEQDALGFAEFAQTVGHTVMIALNGSFEKGTVSQGKKATKELERAGWAKLDDYAAQITELIDNHDPAVTELTDELTGPQKKMLATKLTPAQITHLKKMSEI